LTRGWSALGFALVALTASRAEAGRNTYCVGGYEGVAPMAVTVAACDMPNVRQLHRVWHFHSYISDKARCYICYDEQDDTCDTRFLVDNPRFHKVQDWYECGESHSADDVVAHVIDGKPIQKTPVSPPLELVARVEHITGGPYTAGDQVTVKGTVRDGQGRLRPVTSGAFRLTDADGHASDVPGRVQPDGTVTAELTLPASGSLRLEFVPAPPPLASGEQLRSLTSTPEALKVEICSLRARIVAPVDLELVLSGQALPLRATLLEADGQTPVAAALTGVSLVFTLSVEGEGAREEKADSSLSASWMPPPSPSPRRVEISAGGRAGARVICPAGPVHVTLSDIGVGFDTSALPRTCYMGLPCQGTARLLRPTAGLLRQRVDELLGDPATRVDVVDSGKTIRQSPPVPEDVYAFDAVYTEAKFASWSLTLHTPRGDFSMPAHEVQIRPPLKLSLPAELDFGSVPAGTEVAKTCRQLDFGPSQAVEEHRWDLAVEGRAGCRARPVLGYINSAGQPDFRPLEPKLVIDALDSKHRWLNVCLEVPPCDGDSSRAGTGLRVTPLTPEFAAQATTVHLRWKIEGKGFLACHAPWLAPLSAVLLVGFILLGIVRPARFPPGTSIWIAGSDKGIQRTSPLLLRESPGSSAGFLRDARLGLHGDGSLNGRLRGAVASLHATRSRGVLVRSTGLLEQQHPRTKKWEPVEGASRGYPPVSGALYRAGGTVFKLELR